MSLKGKCIASVARHGLKEEALIDLNNSWLLLEEILPPWEVDLEFIGEIMFELQQQFDEFEEKAKQKEMYDH